MDRFRKDLEHYGFWDYDTTEVVRRDDKTWAVANFQIPLYMNATVDATFNIYLARRDFHLWGEIRGDKLFYRISRELNKYELPKYLRWLDAIPGLLDWLDRETRT